MWVIKSLLTCKVFSELQFFLMTGSNGSSELKAGMLLN